VHADGEAEALQVRFEQILQKLLKFFRFQALDALGRHGVSLEDPL
jgi:hypothetical protein